MGQQLDFVVITADRQLTLLEPQRRERAEQEHRRRARPDDDPGPDVLPQGLDPAIEAGFGGRQRRVDHRRDFGQGKLLLEPKQQNFPINGGDAG